MVEYKKIVKTSIKEFLNENVNNSNILTDVDFIKRVPFFVTI